MERAWDRGATGTPRRTSQRGRLRWRAAGWMGLAAWLVCAPEARASTLALIEAASQQELQEALEAARVQALVEIGQRAAVVELGAGQRARGLRPGVRVVEAGAPASRAGAESQAERVFRRAVEPRTLRDFEPPACSTRTEAESLAEYRALIAASPWLQQLDALLGPLLNERGVGLDQDDSPTDRYIQMRGKIGVAVFFLESETGAGLDEDWTQSDADEILAGIVRSALGWTRVAPPQMRLSFAIVSYAPGSAVSAVSVEPSHDVREGEWIHEAMVNAGFDYHLGSLGYSYEVGAFSRWARDQLFHSDVAFPVFAVTDRVHPATWGEPAWPHVNPVFTYMVLDSTRGDGVVFGHEVGHIFYADDEYAVNGLYCLCIAQPVGGIRVRESGGAIGRTNANCENCNASPIDCIMLDDAWLDDVDGPDACWHSRAQIGWYDTGALHVQVHAPQQLPSEQVDITLDGAPIGSIAAQRYLRPGEYRLDVKAEGYRANPPMPSTLYLAGGQELHFDVTLSPSSTPSVSVR